MNTKNAVIVGYGAIGTVHAAAVVASSYARLYGVCDCDKTHVENAAQKYHCKTFDNIDDVLKDDNVDCVHICTPHWLHADMLCKTVSSGKKAVVEKPVAMNLKEIETIKSRCSGFENYICAILQNRFNPCVKKIKEIIDSGKYGKVLGGSGFLTWHRDKAYYESGNWRGRWDTEGGGVVINQAIHVLDLLEYLCGRCIEVKASIDNRTLRDCIEVEDTAEAILKTSDGAKLIFYATNGYATSSPFDMEIRLEQAALKYIFGKLFLAENDDPVQIEADNTESIGKRYWGNKHIELIDNYYSSLCGIEKPYTNLNDGFDAVRLVDGVYRSAKSGAYVKL